MHRQRSRRVQAKVRCLLEGSVAKVQKVSSPGMPPQRISTGPTIEKLTTMRSASTYYCQASEILAATSSLSALGRFGICLKDIRKGNRRLSEFLRQACVWSFWRARQAIFGAFPRGNQKRTPTKALGLKQGDLVAVRSLAEISETLDTGGRNRGLRFTPDMRLRCGQRYRVADRADKLIADGTGSMYSLRNTVLLEDATYESDYYAFGGCRRREYQYWREIWLKRIGPSSSRLRDF